MKKILLIGILFCISFTVYAQINDYELTFIKTITIGEEEGLIGWNGRALRHGGPPGPNTFAINKDYKIYVPDLVNDRVNIYNADLNYLSIIIEEKGSRNASGAFMIKFDGEGYLIVAHHYGLAKISLDGKRVFAIERDVLPPNMLSSRSIFPFDDHIFFYDEYGYVRSIDPDGNIQKPGRSMEVLNEINQRQMGFNQQSRDASILKASSEDVSITEMILQDRKHIIVGNQFFTTDRYKMDKYYQELEKENSSSRSFNAESIKSLDIGMSGIGSRYLQGYDNDNNSYWIALEESTRKRLILIYSKTGTILDAFYYDDINKLIANDEQTRKVAIAPNGDVYFMRNDGKGSHFWKVERRW